jgi:hypothetical protein
MGIQSVTGKMGNMRKAQSWVIYPRNNSDQREVTIQCDNRIARVNLDTGKAILSDGKGGHQGFMKLQPMLGAVEVDCPQDMLDQLKAKFEAAGVGAVKVLG